ncbi:MAG: helicase RepA family protein [Bacteroidetes bacterium]|nr:helicase RepA family protein [Bacteroidota bacterium]
MKAIKITTDNYFNTIDEIGFENLPQALKESHTAIIAKTNEGEDWSGGSDFKSMVNLSFKKLEEFIKSSSISLSGISDEHPETKRAKADIKGYKKFTTERLKMIYRLELDAELEDGEQEWIAIRKSAIEKILKERGESLDGKQESGRKRKNPYGEISTEVKFINRFLDFNDKVLYKKTFEIFIDELQKAIEEKKITKKSPVAKDIMSIQQAVLKAFNTMGNAKHFVLTPATVKRLKSIIEKYENAYDDIDESYTKVKKKKMDLSGINNSSQQVNVMPSTDFTNLQFNAVGFTGKWLDFIGDPAPGFTAMVFGMPKMGKSYLCVDFAGYLARNHGKVLYVAKEEKLDATLQKKLKDKDVAHENLFVADALPKDLSPYEFIFLDSVNKLGLTPKDLDALKVSNKGKSFIYVFQATKGGKFKGNNEFQHDVDVVIEVPEQGKAVQFGRFNQGGELDIFGDNSISDAEELNGVRKSGKNLDVPNKVSNVDTMKKKTTKTEDWTEPEYLDKQDHAVLKEINRLYKAKKYKEAMSRAMDADTVIREEIPPEIWKQMGGELTKTGEEKLRQRQGKTQAKVNQPTKQKPTIVFNGTIRLLKGVIEREWDLELTDADYIEILDIAQERSVNFHDVVNEIHPNLNAFLTQMAEALKIWDQSTGKSEQKSRSKFDPRFYENRKDDDNPSYIFSLTSNRLLSEAIKGDFDLIYLVRRELANRGLDSNGKWVGFDEAKKIHRI